jgi:CDP-glucose 4,6-dehydratase
MSWADVYRGRRVLVTGHTGFKGSWLALWLAELGAEVVGYALSPPTRPSLFEAARVGANVTHCEGDVRDLEQLREAWRAAKPDVVFHLAAQPIVRESYRDPLTTVQTNVLGTAHVLELARTADRPVALVVITSDKCYENVEWVFGYRETDPMGGQDVYSASKGAAELLVAAWRRSFKARCPHLTVASVRAGNVIGGGDWAADRIVPDSIRALAAGRPIAVRNPHAVRPWQHVLEPLSGYLLLGSRLLADDRDQYAEAWNFGPQPDNARTVREVVEEILANWGSGRWHNAAEPNAPHEAGLLQLCVDKARVRLGWRPRWDFRTTLHQTVAWYRAFHAGEDMAAWCRRQIAAYVGATPR